MVDIRTRNLPNMNHSDRWQTSDAMMGEWRAGRVMHWWASGALDPEWRTDERVAILVADVRIQQHI
jgi:hypothetical protein